MKKLLLTHMRLLTTLIISLMVSGCSYQTYLMVLNPHNESRRVTLAHRSSRHATSRFTN